MDAAFCPKCSGQPVAIETATAHLIEPVRVDLMLRCGCGVQWPATDLALEHAILDCRDVIERSGWIGASHAALGMLLEVSGHIDNAYEVYSIALRCRDAFDRGFCLERRAAYQARHGWLRNALTSMRLALTEDNHASGARQAPYREAIVTLERALAASTIAVPTADRAAHDKRWLRDCELEMPPGHGARNEVGQPLTEDVIEIERLIRAERWDDAVTALKALSTSDANKLVDAIGYASRGAELARAAGRSDAAIALQTVVVHAYEVWASSSTSGAEGMSRSADVERERKRLRAWECGL